MKQFVMAASAFGLLTIVACKSGDAERRENIFECFEDGHCDVHDCQAFSMGIHYFHPDTFNVWAKRFHDPILQPRTYTVKDINKMMSSLDCMAGAYIDFDARELENSSNADIVLTPVAHPINGKYSLMFLKGAIRMNELQDDDKFLFYKVTKSNGEVTLAVKVEKGGNTVYVADLVGLYP